MQKVMSARLNEEDLDFIKKEAEKNKTDKAKVLRELLEKGRLQLAVEQYRQGKISLGTAAEKAGIPIGEMIDELAERGIKNRMTKEQFLQSMKNLESEWK